jgi:hypothetical protein
MMTKTLVQMHMEMYARGPTQSMRFFGLQSYTDVKVKSNLPVNPLTR